MMINEVSKRTKLTKKAIEYYVLQGLISPSVLENGYRSFDHQDVETLNKISILRKLDISTEDIQRILNDKTNAVLQAVSVKRELDTQRNLLKKSILHKLSQGASYDEISQELQAVEQSRTITDQLLDAFPGYYGRFICMHFARFLNEPIRTSAQQRAYETILSFLDHLPVCELPKEVEEYFWEETKHIGTEQIVKLIENNQTAYQNPERFLSENKEMLEAYLEYRMSDEYKESPAGKLMEWMRALNSTNGYNDVFIPAMKQLSPSYAAYFQQMEEANEKLLKQYPAVERLIHSGE